MFHLPPLYQQNDSKKVGYAHTMPMMLKGESGGKFISKQHIAFQI
jgi:hypothetical protein